MPDPAFEKDCTIGSSIAACSSLHRISHSHFDSLTLLDCSIPDCRRLHNMSSYSSPWVVCFDAYFGRDHHDGVRLELLNTIENRRSEILHPSAQKRTDYGWNVQIHP